MAAQSGGKSETMADLYMLMRQGKVQFVPATQNGKTLIIWPMASTHEDAKRFARWHQMDASPALIGSAPCETLEIQIEAALEAGCDAAACVRGWNMDGSPIMGFIMYD
jgi:hypothetical protein